MRSTPGVMGRVPALLCLWCACTASARPVSRPGRVLAPLPERENHRAKHEPLHISAAAQHNLSESYRRYLELKRTPPAKLLEDAKEPSVADLTEQQLPRETVVEYLSHSVGLKRAWASAKFSKSTGDLVFQSLRNKPSEKLWKQRAGGWELPEKTEEQRPAAPAADKAPDNAPWEPDKAPWKPAEKKPWEQRAEANKKRWEWNKAHPNKKKIRDVEGTDMVSLRCGQSWDDAAVKCGEACNGFCPEGVCYKDLPECDQMFPAGKCYGAHEGVSDSWCTMAAVTSSKRDDYGPFVVASEFHANCICDDDAIGLNDFVEPVPNYSQNASGLPRRSDQLIEAVAEKGRLYPGLPACTWNPPADAKCSNASAYECMAGAKAGQCSADNWYDKPSECGSSCVHTALLNWVPYSAVWRAGPRATMWKSDEQLPHYIAQDKAVAAFAAQKQVFENPLRVMMSTYCRSKQIRFVGVSLFSPHYESKAARLVESCNRLGVCCKATEMRPDALGAGAPEGSEEFRFRVIALKPLFILDQLEKTKEPVVYLDVDLEFHKFPKLFLPGSWPDGPRDVALFNFHSNASNLTMRMSDQAVGSAVAYFNQTYRAKKLLTAWAEAMMYGTNGRAPDDQVLDTLLNYGGWMARCSLGWLPAAYLRLMPAFYRGVETVIDHDHGSVPGINGHSQLKPQLPDVVWREPVTQLEITKSQGDGDGYTGPTEATIESDQRERVKKAKMRGEDVGGMDESILPTPGGKIICKTLMPDTVTDEWCTLNCATSARRDPTDVANEDLEDDCPPDACACPEDLLDAVDKAESESQRKVDEREREEAAAAAKVAAEEKAAWQQQEASEEKDRDPNAPWDGHGNPPGYDGNKEWGDASKDEEAPEKAVAGATCTSMKTDLADDEWCDQSCLLEGRHVSTDDGCDPEYCTCPWEQAAKREQEKMGPEQHPERSIQIGGPDAGSPTTTSTGAPSSAAIEDQAGRAAQATKEAEAAAAAELEAEAKAMDDRRTAGVEAAKAEAARAEAEASRAEAEAAKAEAAKAEVDAEAAAKARAAERAAEDDTVQDVSEQAARAAAAAHEDAQAAQSDTEARGWGETMTAEEKAAADAADAEAVAGAKDGGAWGAAEEVKSPEEEAAAALAEAEAVANAEAAMATEDDAAAKAAAAAEAAAAAAAAEEDLPGKGCSSLQPELVSDMWCKENCGLSKWNGPVGSDACDREFCKCPGDEDRKQQGAESDAARGRQNADGSITPPSKDDGGWNPGPPPSVDPGPSTNGAPDPVPGVGAGSTQQSQPSIQIGGPDAGYPVGEHAPAPEPEVPADRRSTPEAPTPSGCCGGNGMSSCWGCGNDGKGWCHSAKDACDPKCNGTWMEAVAPPVCRGEIDAHGPGGGSASPSSSSAAASSAASSSSASSASSSSSSSASSSSADASYEERLRIQRNSVQRNGVDAAPGVFDAASSSTINPSSANPSSANPSSANDWALKQPNAASLSRSAADSESGVQSIKGDDERAQREATKAERRETKAEGKMEHDNQVAINEAEKQRQRESAEAAHREAKEARVAADAKRKDLHDELKAQRQAGVGPLTGPADGENATAAVSTAPPSAVEMARREAQAALDAARAESEAAHRAAEAHRKEFEERLDKRKAQREAEAAEARKVTSFRALRAAPFTASRTVAAAPAPAAHAAPAAAASGVNSYGETVPSPEALRALLAKAKAAKANKPS